MTDMCMSLVITAFTKVFAIYTCRNDSLVYTIIPLKNILILIAEKCVGIYFYQFQQTDSSLLYNLQHIHLPNWI